ncbi:MAG: hypothetical protein IK147_00450 [Clostridia bacterium]|nr:hypothetical protein [Clostridia bacterium]
MKKRLIKILTLAFAVIMCFSASFGCNLVTKDNLKDMEQVVATVNINKEDNVYKRDVVMAYINYGYIYVQYYGYSQQRTMQLILDGLIESHIMVQEAMNVFENDATFVKDDAYPAYTAERYLSEEDRLSALYDTYVTINDLLDRYSDEEKPAENKDDLNETVRTVPTDAKNAEKDVDKQAYIDEGFDVDSNEYRVNSLAKVVKMLKSNGLLGDAYQGDIRDTDYFAQIKKTNMEQKVVDNYEEKLLSEVRSELAYDRLSAAYLDKKTEQENWSNAEFVSALSSATAEKPVLYSRQGTYGYVYNLLLGVNDYQSKEISDLNAESNLSDAERAARRAEILNSTTVKDLRSTWILSGYDFDGEKFTGDYTFAKDPANSLPFKGEVNLLKDATEEDPAVYGVEDVYTYGLKDFVAMMNEYVYGNAAVGENDADVSVYKKYDCNVKPAEYENKINELLFAFSTDGGSLNTYKGYVIKPAVDGANTEEYVKTFGDAGRTLLTMGDASYIIVASDYGYHVMFFSLAFDADYGYDTLDEYLDSLDIDIGGYATYEEYFNAMLGDWEEFEKSDNYLYFLSNELISGKTANVVSAKRTEIVNRYVRETDGAVKVYENRMKDLFGN